MSFPGILKLCRVSIMLQIWHLDMYISIEVPEPTSQQHHHSCIITAASMKKSHLWRFFTDVDLSENMRIGQNQSLQHFDRCLLKLGN